MFLVGREHDEENSEFFALCVERPRLAVVLSSTFCLHLDLFERIEPTQYFGKVFCWLAYCKGKHP